MSRVNSHAPSQAFSAASSKSDKRVLSWQKDVAQSPSGSSVASSSTAGTKVTIPADIPIRTHGGGGASIAPSSVSSDMTITPENIANIPIRTHGGGAASVVSSYMSNNRSISPEEIA